MARTYLSKLVEIVRTLCRYTTKYQTQINSVLDSDGKVAFAALVVACNAFLGSDIPEQAKND